VTVKLFVAVSLLKQLISCIVQKKAARLPNVV